MTKLTTTTHWHKKMSIIQAYKSDADGKLFEDKKKYQSHLRKLAARRRYDRKVQDAENKKIAFWRDNFWNKVKSLAQLEKALFVHAEQLGLNGLANESFYTRRRPPGPPILKEFDQIQFVYSDSVSNSHRCPHNGVTNWGGDKKDAPRGYPGFSGRIDYRVEWYSAWDGYYPGGSDMWKDTRIQTGSGGGGGFAPYSKNDPKGLQHFGYSVEIFLADWPGLKEGYDQAKVWKTLNNGTNNDIVELMNKLFPAEDYK